ncbi:hypothetical protein [Halobacteriovorax sp.]|uniref:hypothetical protein n=1 Tax=Halobacteriovorax sp. TaxID=2020862 RepID=UPI003AF2C76A
MIKLALLGKSIHHSKSPDIYAELFNNEVEYTLLDIAKPQSIPSLDEIFKEQMGLSITAPYKTHFINAVEMDTTVRKIGGINCIKKEGSQYIATNTDYLAAKEIFLRENYNEREVVVLGSGTMAKMFNVLFDELNIDYVQYSRKVDGNLNDINFEQEFNLDKLLIINCCARVFHFNLSLSRNTIFWDMNYKHSFHESSLTNKLTYIDGSELLYLQAVAAKKFWNFTL